MAVGGMAAEAMDGMAVGGMAAEAMDGMAVGGMAAAGMAAAGMAADGTGGGGGTAARGFAGTVGNMSPVGIDFGRFSRPALVLSRGGSRAPR